jgi:acetate kinase
MTTILTVNVGSATAKLSLFRCDHTVHRVAATDVARSEDSMLDIWPEALAGFSPAPDAVVHRIVHGGEDYTDPLTIVPAVLDGLRNMQQLAPDHLPPAIDAVDAAIRRFPAARQFACFDTAFHRHMPDVARMYPLSRRLWEAGVRRYGFHGLSCESITTTLAEIDPDAASGRVIVAHLGGGSSLTAIRAGRSVDTTMGFSPAGGVMMSRRSGDLDPGVLLYALEHERLDGKALRTMVTREAGLAGMSGRSGDMRELLQHEASDPRAAQAIDLYCYLARKALGGLIAILGGVDTLVFTGGVGEHAPSIRERILRGMDGLGFVVDPDRNRKQDDVISPDGSPITVRVIPAEEDRVLATHAFRLMSSL